jgi:hypothetical protein
MGLDVEIFGNHNIIFKEKNIFVIANEIKDKLNKINFSNNDFLLYYSLFDKYFNDYSCFEIEKMKKIKYWDYYVNGLESDYNECGYIQFYGYYNLKLDISENNIDFLDPICRFKTWFEYGKDDDYVNEWRKYYKQIVSTFGGNRVVYYPDYGIDSYSGVLSELPFEEFEKEYSKIIKNFDLNEYEKEYFENIKNVDDLFDKLNDIDWDKNYSLKDWQPIIK